jgi:hypothetical protein
MSRVSLRCAGAPSRNAKHWLPYAIILGVSILSGGCGTHVAVREPFPRPVMQKLPFSVGLYLGDAFVNHVHRETLPGGRDWSIDLGEANATLFRQLVTGMFEEVAPVQRLAAGGALDAVIRPSIEDYQFSTPQQSGTDYFEAWIEYRMHVYSPRGKLVAEWPVTAYGRSPAEFLGANDALLEASVRAMRDAAAAVVLGFAQRPAVRAYLYKPPARPPAGSVSQKPLNDGSAI